jgi:hypothetical protein
MPNGRQVGFRGKLFISENMGQTGNPSAPQPCTLECVAIGDHCKTG